MAAEAPEPGGAATPYPIDDAIAERCFRLMPEPHKPGADEALPLSLGYLPLIGETLGAHADALARVWPGGGAVLAVRDRIGGRGKARFDAAWRMARNDALSLTQGRWLIFPERGGALWYGDATGAGILCSRAQAETIQPRGIAAHIAEQEARAMAVESVVERAFWLAVCLNARACWGMRDTSD